MTTDWKQVADTLSFDVSPRQPYSESERALAAAIRLCELAAKLPAGEAERVLERAVEKQNHHYITVTSGMSGWFAVEVRDNEPWQSGVGRFERHEDAELEAKAWAQEDGLTYRRSKH